MHRSDQQRVHMFPLKKCLMQWTCESSDNTVFNWYHRNVTSLKMIQMRQAHKRLVLQERRKEERPDKMATEIDLRPQCVLYKEVKNIQNEIKWRQRENLRQYTTQCFKVRRSFLRQRKDAFSFKEYNTMHKTKHITGLTCVLLLDSNPEIAWRSNRGAKATNHIRSRCIKP